MPHQPEQMEWIVFVWGWLVVNTRCISLNNRISSPKNQSKYVTESDSIALAPFLDLLNHTSLAKVSAIYDGLANEFYIQTDVPYKKGKEVFINYGPHENAFLLAEYGFVDIHNPFLFIQLDKYVLKWLKTNQHGPILEGFEVDIDGLVIASERTTDASKRRYSLHSMVMSAAVNTLRTKGLWLDYTLEAGEPSQRLIQALRLLLGLSWSINSINKHDLQDTKTVHRKAILHYTAWTKCQTGQASSISEFDESLVEQFIGQACQSYQKEAIGCLEVGRLTSCGVSSKRHVIQELELVNALGGHGGCVNALCWSEDGSMLVSGSDDTNVCLWDMKGEPQLVHVIHTGHEMNIFSVKLLPQPNDHILVTCSRDKEIRVFDLNKMIDNLGSITIRPHTLLSGIGYQQEESNVQVLDGNRFILRVCRCHTSSVKRIATIPDSPYEFLSCGNDGRVIHHDIRENHHCFKENTETRLFKNTIVNYGKHRIDFNSISVNKFRPHLFAIGGSARYIFLHDCRMINSNAGEDETKTSCIARFQPQNPINRYDDGDDDVPAHMPSDISVTGVKFSSSNSHDLLGSWSFDYVYLFDINDCSPARMNSGIKFTNTTLSNNTDTAVSDTQGSWRKRPESSKLDIKNMKTSSNDSVEDHLRSMSGSTSASSASPEKNTNIRRVRQRVGPLLETSGSGRDSGRGSHSVSVHLSGSDTNSPEDPDGPDSEERSMIDGLMALDTAQKNTLSFYHHMAAGAFRAGKYKDAIDHISCAMRQVSDGSSHDLPSNEATRGSADDQSSRRPKSFAERKQEGAVKRLDSMRYLRSIQYTNRATLYLYRILSEWLYLSIPVPFRPSAPASDILGSKPDPSEYGLPSSSLDSDSSDFLLDSCPGTPPRSMLASIRRDTEISLRLNPQNLRSIIINIIADWIECYSTLIQALKRLTDIVVSLNGSEDREDYNIQLSNFECDYGDANQYIASISCDTQEILNFWFEAGSNGNQDPESLASLLSQALKDNPPQKTDNKQDLANGDATSSKASPQNDKDKNHQDDCPDALPKELHDALSTLIDTVNNTSSCIEKIVRREISRSDPPEVWSNQDVLPKTDIERKIVLLKETIRQGFFAAMEPHVPLEAQSSRVDKLISSCFLATLSPDFNDDDGSDNHFKNLLSLGSLVKKGFDGTAWSELVKWEEPPGLVSLQSLDITLGLGAAGQDDDEDEESFDGSEEDEGWDAEDSSDPIEGICLRTNDNDDDDPRIDMLVHDILQHMEHHGWSDDQSDDTDNVWLDSPDTYEYYRDDMSDIDDDSIDSEAERRTYRNLTSVRDFLASPSRCEEDTPIYHEKLHYSGHSNAQTIKDVNFFGPNDEYVVSGSDDGNWFTWKKSTGEIVQVLQGDHQVVNVIEPCPFYTMLAVSGIDSTIQIFSVSASGPHASHIRRLTRSRHGDDSDDSRYSTFSDPITSNSDSDSGSDQFGSYGAGNALDSIENGYADDPSNLFSREHRRVSRRRPNARHRRNRHRHLSSSYPSQSTSRMDSLGTILSMNTTMRLQSVNDMRVTHGLMDIFNRSTMPGLPVPANIINYSVFNLPVIGFGQFSDDEFDSESPSLYDD
ncbi:hypothetical protein H4219_004333 [Mycoemilia scoparia]|uniref:Uncharacterized protein n=1 Tax=Mycoemilia scoparia TaxID=417184 RepID=A0A9W7ZS01_9FUNG|nr:hypothetical protein H4219_004333 [Mycoemilia scoparia]